MSVHLMAGLCSASNLRSTTTRTTLSCPYYCACNGNAPAQGLAGCRVSPLGVVRIDNLPPRHNAPASLYVVTGCACPFPCIRVDRVCGGLKGVLAVAPAHCWWVCLLELALCHAAIATAEQACVSDPLLQCALMQFEGSCTQMQMYITTHAMTDMRCGVGGQQCVLLAFHLA